MPGRERNLEITAVDLDPEAMLQAALSFGAEDQGVLLQRDTYFHAASGRLHAQATPRAGARVHVSLVHGAGRVAA